MNNVETTELKPFIYLFLNFVVGALVAKGYVDGASKDVLINASANFIGLLILLATSGVTLWRVIKHPHSTTLPINNGKDGGVTIVKETDSAALPAGSSPLLDAAITDLSEQAAPLFTEALSTAANSGTPSQTEQVPSSKNGGIQ